MAETAEPQGTTVRLSFQPLPVHVRTARLVAVTVARRAGWAEEQVESVRQAVGEACALALRAAAGRDAVTLELDDADPAGDLVAWVAPVTDVPRSSDVGEDALLRAVLAGLTHDVSVVPRRGRPALRLVWSR
ncbi:ATP-binding protein [Angustibacter sp. Root456]|uniref:ATP-binding protein n=1 Tax=Angustibacter sp. Root456 TaxID=1736539 RepID=UPI0006F8F04E|nr:ATP-binding protein [Angustibacter sp. Root456]KQX61632.1 hypothetical protein ASD06_13565 [Angustibacter sp. Root456]